MSSYPHIDNRSLEFLTYIFQHDRCTVRSLLETFGVTSIGEAPETISTVLYFVRKDYIALLKPNGDFVSSFNVDYFLNLSRTPGNAMISPDCKLTMLPEGRFIIEEIKRQKRYFNIPLVVSIASAVFTGAIALLQYFSETPVLVKIIEDLTK